MASCTDASETPAPGEPEDLLEGLRPDQLEQLEEAWAREQVASSPQQLKDAWMLDAPRLVVDQRALELMLRDVIFRPDMGRPREWGDLEALSALAVTDKPVLAIGAEHDRAQSEEAARRIAATAPRGDLLIVEGTGHFPFAEAPERYWPPLIAWLSRTEADSSG